MASNSGNEDAGGFVGPVNRWGARRHRHRKYLIDIPRNESFQPFPSRRVARQDKNLLSPYVRKTLSSTFYVPGDLVRQTLTPTELLETIIKRNKMRLRMNFIHSDVVESVRGEASIKDILFSLQKLCKLLDDIKEKNLSMDVIIAIMEEDGKEMLINIRNRDNSDEVPLKYSRKEVEEIIGPFDAFDFEGSPPQGGDRDTSPGDVCRHLEDMSLVTAVGDQRKLLREIEGKFSVIDVNEAHHNQDN